MPGIVAQRFSPGEKQPSKELTLLQTVWKKSRLRTLSETKEIVVVRKQEEPRVPLNEEQ